MLGSEVLTSCDDLGVTWVGKKERMNESIKYPLMAWTKQHEANFDERVEMNRPKRGTKEG